MQTGGIDLSSQSSDVCLVGLGWLKGFRNPHPTGSARFARCGSARTRIAARCTPFYSRRSRQAQQHDFDAVGLPYQRQIMSYSHDASGCLRNDDKLTTLP